MVVELIYQETLDVIQKSEAKPYIKNALDIINFMVMNNLEDINSCDRYFMALTFDERISYPEMYGYNNYCRALSHCNGRLPSNGICCVIYLGIGTTSKLYLLIKRKTFTSL